MGLGGGYLVGSGGCSRIVGKGRGRAGGGGGGGSLEAKGRDLGFEGEAVERRPVTIPMRPEF